MGSVPSFSTGSYGTDTHTEVLYTPFTARRLFADGDITLVLPFTCVRGNGAVTVVDGAPVRTDTIDRRRSDASTTARSGAAGSGGTRTGTAPDGTRPSVTDPIAAAETAAPVAGACGMGDIVLRGRYYLVDERAWLPTIAIRAHVKTPTASAERGLGTGRADEGIGIEISRRIAGGLTVMLDGGYTAIGDPPDVDFDNTWWYDVGLGYDIARDAVNVSVFFDEFSSVVPGLATARDVLTVVTLRSGGGWRVQMSVQAGLSPTAPDRAFSVGASRRF
jgi:hypothetical protein